MSSLDKACDKIDDFKYGIDKIVHTLNEAAKKESDKGVTDPADPLCHAGRAVTILRVAESLAHISHRLEKDAEMLKLIEDYLDGEVGGVFFEGTAFLHFHFRNKEKQ